ncbi:MAG: pyridoxamine 5'-phosphate oxidase family protein [Gammaproteobacteria bacterium]|nr:pyridoxamine 5'-phosphate oxidase family protein [Gammaproteobacteria bacterium]
MSYHFSCGNLQENNKGCLFFMDYPNGRALNAAGRVEVNEKGKK